ncbi:hypothetical protein [Paenibacillus sp. GCM10027626]|uniref:hypothetical protein n=1 Tax=Paenibacillus sp. GCM10027626 TaxID=3273411 RepID=UPI00362BE779
MTQWSDKIFDIYLFAGVATGPNMFQECRIELDRRHRGQENSVVAGEFFPYGFHEESLVKQVWQVRRDMLSRKHGSGVQEAASYIKERLPGRRKLLLIGHSGGGIAAYRTAVQLRRWGTKTEFHIIQVGSPKMRFAEELRKQITYIVAVDEQGKEIDRVARLGSWGGWSKGRNGLPYWNKHKHAPGRIETITLIGGHPHYFCSSEKYVHPERGSNLALTLDAIWGGFA